MAGTSGANKYYQCSLTSRTTKSKVVNIVERIKLRFQCSLGPSFRNAKGRSKISRNGMENVVEEEGQLIEGAGPS